jgi:CBS domain-containing protein
MLLHAINPVTIEFTEHHPYQKPFRDMGGIIVKVKGILREKPATVITITADQSLLAASQLLAEHNIGAVVVVDDDGAPVGILSERDIVRKLAALQADAVDYKVGDAMTEDIIVGFPEDDLSYVSSTMTDKRIRHLPIMEDQRLVGIVSIGDVVKAQLAHFKSEAHWLHAYITGTHA